MSLPNVSLIIPLLLIILFPSIIITPAAFAQTYYQSPYDKFTVQIPEGWVIQDSSAAETQSLTGGFVTLALLCLEEESFPGYGGTFRCSSNDVYIVRLDNLHSRPELRTLEQQNKSITVNDLIPLTMDIFTGVSAQNSDIKLLNVRVENITDTSVNITNNSQTNQTIGTAPAKRADFAFNFTTTLSRMLVGESIGIPVNAPALLVLSNDTNTGYFVIVATQTEEAAKPIMDSFALIE